MKKICFVIMGFGKKMDYRNSKEVNMDLIYQYVIQELFKTEFEEYEVIRADEISGSAIIDVSMYTLLINADLVIADITTLNENAIYELGVRHALKPYSTIIMMQNSDKAKAPFDLNHCRVLLYKDYGEKLSMEEAKVIKHDLKKFVVASEEQETDSPFYTYLPNVNPPRWNEKRSSTMIEDIKKKEDNIAIHRERAEKRGAEVQLRRCVCGRLRGRVQHRRLRVRDGPPAGRAHDPHQKALHRRHRHQRHNRLRCHPDPHPAGLLRPRRYFRHGL